jgi:hypothetical protein
MIFSGCLSWKTLLLIGTVQSIAASTWGFRQGRVFTAGSQLATALGLIVPPILVLSSNPVATTPQRKDMVSQLQLRLAQIMQIFAIMIPLMLLGIAIAVVPLLVAMRHQEELEDSPRPITLSARERNEQIAA